MSHGETKNAFTWPEVHDLYSFFKTSFIFEVKMKDENGGTILKDNAWSLNSKFWHCT